MRITAGTQYGLLTAIAPAGKDKSGTSVWLFQCQCGNQHIARGTRVMSGRTKSCGCLQNRSNWKRLPEELRLKNVPQELQIPRRAWLKNYSDGCSFEDFLRLSQEPCHYCGALRMNNWQGWQYNGLDRKDSTRAHTLDNVVPCCKDCNFAKGTRSYQQFLDWIGRVSLFNRSSC